MRVFNGLLAASWLIWLTGCSSAPTSPSPLSQRPPEAFTVSGTLYETVDGVSRPLAGRQVRLLVVGASCGQGCTTEREHVFFADDNGRYMAPVAPNTRVFAYVRDTSGPWQPCLASAFVNQDTTIDLHVVPVGSSLTPPAAAGPMITGLVYETTAQGRQPLRGVVVWLEAGANGYLVAVTQTDDTGRFFLCRVNAPVWMGVSSREEWFESVAVTADTFFEIELGR